jgi:predicted HTH domain antitoxin
MQITIEIPDNMSDRLQLKSPNLSRRILELIVADNYRQGNIGAGEVRRFLNFSSRWETYEFLKREKAYLPYIEEDLESDVRAIKNLLESDFTSEEIPSSSQKRRQPSPSIAGKGKTIGDLVDSIVNEQDWECLK